MANNNGNGDVPQGLKKINPWLKMALLILGILAFVGGGIWQLNSTFASKNHVKAVEVNAEKGRILLAEESVKTLQQFQDKMRQENIQRQIKSDVRYWTQLISETKCRVDDLKNQIRRQPGDKYLQERLMEEQARLKHYNQRLDEILK
jgi:hypothetical protein